MKIKGARVTPAVGAALVLAVACGPDVEERPKQVEHRIGPCTKVCESMQSPECGNVEHPRFPVFASVSACVESCANPELENWWGGPQEDGTDACVDEWNTYADCVTALSCDDQYKFWNASRVSDYPCKEQSVTQVHCGEANHI